MKSLKKLFNIILVLCLMIGVMAFAACNDETDDPNKDNGETTTQGSANTQDNTEETTGASGNNGKTTYTVTVVDENNNPIAGIDLKFCVGGINGSCKMPETTNEQGVVTVTYKTDTYCIGILSEGYNANAEGYYFADGATSITIVLTTVAE